MPSLGSHQSRQSCSRTRQTRASTCQWLGWAWEILVCAIVYTLVQRTVYLQLHICRTLWEQRVCCSQRHSVDARDGYWARQRTCPSACRCRCLHVPVCTSSAPCWMHVNAGGRRTDAADSYGCEPGIGLAMRNAGLCTSAKRSYCLLLVIKPMSVS